MWQVYKYYYISTLSAVLCIISISSVDCRALHTTLHVMYHMYTAHILQLKFLFLQ